MKKHTVFYASGSKGKEVRADGKGSHMARGFYFIGFDGKTYGPHYTRRQADLACGEDALAPYRQRMHAAVVAHEDAHMNPKP